MEEVNVGLTFGSDPEFMIEKEDGTKISAIKVLKGFDKHNKLSLTYDQKTFYDNVLMEFNVAPASTFREFEEHMGACLRFAQQLLARDGYYLKQQASATYPLSECQDKESQVFGCDPEYCIYKLDKNGIIRQLDPPSLPKGNTFRSCGGHIHIGHPIASPNGGRPPLVVKLMDLFVGNTAILIDHDKTSRGRRRIYGGAGTHRIADYGLEYRTLSNFWLRSPRWAEVIFRLTRLAVQLALAKPDLAHELATNEETESIINAGDRERATALYEKTKRCMPDDLQDRIETLVDVYPESLEVEWGLRTPTAKKLKPA